MGAGTVPTCSIERTAVDAGVYWMFWRRPFGLQFLWMQIFMVVKG